MKRLLAIAVLLLAPCALAEDLTGRVLVSFQRYDLDRMMTSGLRQTYDVQWQRAFSTTTLFRLGFRADDFRGTTETALISEDSRSRQLQPSGEIIVNTGALRIQARSEMLDTDASRGGFDTTSTLKRSWGMLEWRPAGLPTVDLRGQRNETTHAGANLALTDDLASAGLRYEWHGLQARAEERYLRSSDSGSGYDRKATSHIGELNYSLSTFGGKLTVGASTAGAWTNVSERSLDARTSSIPVPVPIGRAFWSFDETPNDSRDHPLAPYPLLTDGNLNASASINLGPAATSFQNIALDLGRNDAVDEIRVVVRDAAGNPIRTGGGPVTWDLYTSEDGQLWTPRFSETAWVGALSHHAVTFDRTTARWFKVVNFGVNVEATLVTEVQAYMHRELAPGETRDGTQNQYSVSAVLAAQPWKRLRLTYTGAYNSFDEELTTITPRSSTNLEHIGEVQLELLRSLTLRERVLARTASTFDGLDDSASGLTTFVDWIPTRDLRVSLELGRESQTLGATELTLDTRVVHASATVIPAVLLSLEAGTQTQTFEETGLSAERQFMSLNGSMQLLRSLRLSVLASTQRTDDVAVLDPNVGTLGPHRDDRVSTELTWRPGRPLTLRGRVGWTSGAAISGFTQRYRAEWYPFADGTLSLGGTYDQDIDPVLGRRASRLVFNPRWMMNRFATFDINYTAVSSSYASISDRQRTLFATLTLTR